MGGRRFCESLQLERDVHADMLKKVFTEEVTSEWFIATRGLGYGFGIGGCG